jgi:hypothetical protein
MWASAWSRLQPRSRLRRAVLARIVRQGCEAANRRDFDLLFLGLDPAIEFELPESLVGGYVPPDLVGVHHGYAGYLRVWEGIMEAWPDLRLQPEEVIDFGDRCSSRAVARDTAGLAGSSSMTPCFKSFPCGGGW